MPPHSNPSPVGCYNFITLVSEYQRPVICSDFSHSCPPNTHWFVMHFSLRTLTNCQSSYWSTSKWTWRRWSSLSRAGTGGPPTSQVSLQNQGLTNINFLAWLLGINQQLSFTCLHLFWSSPEFSKQWDMPGNMSVRLARWASDLTEICLLNVKTYYSPGLSNTTLVEPWEYWKAIGNDKGSNHAIRNGSCCSRISPVICCLLRENFSTFKGSVLQAQAMLHEGGKSFSLDKEPIWFWAGSA